jgi:sulfite reductase (NADPH) hemoprotein beta-component
LRTRHHRRLREDDTQLIKFHGSYQQDDRDLREERRLQKLEPAYSFMIRTRLPGGVATPAQWLALDAIATRYANHTLRLTTRQAFQFHGVIKRDLKATMQAINAALIDTIAACGDVNRNVLASANPVESRAACRGARLDRAPVRAPAAEHARLSRDLARRREAPRRGRAGVEPIYGHLPAAQVQDRLRRAADQRCRRVRHDLGFIAIIEDGKLVGFNVASAAAWAPPTAMPAPTRCSGERDRLRPPEQLLVVAEAVLTAQRDFGNRANAQACAAQVHDRWHLTLRIEAGALPTALVQRT